MPGQRAPFLGAGTEIVAPDGRILMIEQERHGGIEWAGSGGALEPDEPIRAAAIREAREETGLSVRLERLISVTEFWEESHLRGIGFLFLATPDPWPQDVQLPAVDGITRFLSYQWCTREEVMSLEPRWRFHITRTAWPADIVEPLFLRVESEPALRIRSAHADEAEALTALAHRSKAHWGYDAAFLERVLPDIAIERSAIEAGEVWVLEDATGEIIGLHRLAVRGTEAVLEDLWLEPGLIGAGHGRRLWEHAMSTARAAGATAIELDADPNAAGFYERMGAVRVGETPSRLVPGRSLPRYRMVLTSG